MKKWAALADLCDDIEVGGLDAMRLIISAVRREKELRALSWLHELSESMKKSLENPESPWPADFRLPSP